ncbi:phage holin family protein [Sediminibacterium soli]|uniref:phage holin family protein n=1 Tax=Sediminibacterium soli TaxID=2698829 RepID=UPI00137B72AA|nr:phage holin family protein [Sediminibacterium soli]NCI45880.1 hypothetical protein [Sediminibacterium soli]
METKERPGDDDKNIVELATEYVETYLKLAVVNINLKTTEISAVASFSMIAALLGFFICMFLGLAAAFWLADLLGNTAAGFLIVAGFFLLVFLLLFLTRKKWFFPFIKNLIVRSIYE